MPPRPSRPPKNRPSSRRRPQHRLPLDPSIVVQRPLVGESDSDYPVARLKSTTKHPTVYRKRIADVDSAAQHGDIVRVVADSGETVGYGTWNPRAEATIRILSWGDVAPTVEWWNERLDQAVTLRRNMLGLDDKTNAYRVINAEGDGLPGLVADRYGDILSVEAFSLGMFQRSQAIAERLTERLGISHWIVRPGPMTIDQEGFVAEPFQSGKVPQKVAIDEDGTRFEIQPAAGHKTGFFCDQRENRLRLQEFCKGKTVLDLCCYSGGFAINAAMAGASSVTAVDLDEDAIAFAKRNANLNQKQVKFVHADAFPYMRDMQSNGRSYDVVILDPPKLIRGRDEMHEGQNKYFDLNELAVSLVKPGGLLLTCSCSGLLSMEDFTMTVRAATGERQPRILLRSGAGADHPVGMNCLETEYLKCLWVQIQD